MTQTTRTYSSTGSRKSIMKDSFEFCFLILKDDPRPETFSFVEMEMSCTSDSVFNAAQMQLVLEGRIHPDVSPYWTKKFLEWTSSPKEALR